MIVVTLSLDAIEAGDRLREVDGDWAAVLAESIAEQGQMTPVEVRKLPRDAERPYALVAGAHRLRALELLGWAEVQAVEFAGDELAARLREIDENLMRHELTALDRATFLAERKTVYEALHPETKHGDAERLAPSRQNGDLGALRFSAEAAERLGFGERTIQRSIRMAKLLHPDVRRRLSGTWLADHFQQLDLLASCRRDEQLAAVSLLFDPPVDRMARPKTVGDALDRIRNVHTVPVSKDDAAFERFLSLWRRGSPAFKGRVADYLRREKRA